MTPEKIVAIKKALLYNPVKGTFARLSKHAEKAYMHPNATGAPRISILGKEYSARSLAWLLMTGEYPGKFDIKSIDGNLSNVKWENLTRAKPGHKFCPKCKEEKPHSEYTKNRSRKAGFEAVCKACKKPWTARYARAANIKSYGLTIEQYEALHKRQNGSCAICKQSETISRALAIDHCHSTGAVRGLLCMRCNTAIGKLNTSELLNRAISYLGG